MGSMSKLSKAMKLKEDSQHIAKEPLCASSKKGGRWVERSLTRVGASKSVRQAAFKEKFAGRPAKEAMAAARLIPDASPANFKVLKVCG